MCDSRDCACVCVCMCVFRRTLLYYHNQCEDILLAYFKIRVNGLPRNRSLSGKARESLYLKDSGAGSRFLRWE
jgi:hypothetical protein